MDPTGDILQTWRTLVNPASTIEDCQAALLQIPGTQSFTFEADTTATPADVHGVESGGSILLDSTSPAAKAMAKTVHVGVGVVSMEDCCLGVFNAKDARARMDPVVRVCSLPKSGKGGCTSTSHIHQKITFQGKRVFIRTPTASTATVPAYFSLPYLQVESLPPAKNLMERLIALRAPVAVWRSFMDGSAASIAKIFPGFSSIPTPQTKGGLAIKTDLPSIVPKDESPLSYDMIPEAKEEEDEGEDEHKEEVIQTETPVVEATDLLDINPSAIGVAETALGLGIGLTKEELQLNVQGAVSAEPKFTKRSSSPHYSDASDGDSLFGKQSVERRDSFELGTLYESRGVYPSDAPTHASDRQTPFKLSSPPHPPNADAMSVMFLQQIISSQQTFESRLRSLEKENAQLRQKLKHVKGVSDEALKVGATFASTHTESTTKTFRALAQLRADLNSKTENLNGGDFLKLRREMSAFTPWRDTVNERICSLEVDLRNEDGLLFSQVRECKSAVAAGDLGAFTIAGYTFQNEESVLAFIQTLPGKNTYVTFPSMKDFFSLCGDPVSNLSENMVLHKATKGADFEDTFTARVNTAHVVGLPPVFARKSTSGDSFKTIWTPAFKSYSSFSGGMKNGGRTSVERQLRKVQENYRGQIRRRLPPNLYAQQHAVATAMADRAFLAAFDFLDAISKFYFTMLSAGLPETSAWSNTQEMILRVHEEFEMASCEAAEEDVDAGFIWSSMLICNKVEEFQRFRWGEHPSICSMLMFSILERLGDYQVPSEDTLAAEAMEKCKQNDSVLQELLEKVKKDHETAANAVNQVKQLKEALAKEKKEVGSK